MSGPTNMTIGPEGLRMRQTDATRDVLTRAAKEVQKKKKTTWTTPSMGLSMRRGDRTGAGR